MWHFLVRFFAVLGFAGFVAIIGVGALAYFAVSRDRTEPPPDRFVLRLDMREPVTDGPRPDSLSLEFSDAPLTLREAIAAIDHGSRDDRVIALVAELGDGAGGLASAQELGDAVARFRAAGKPTLVFADSLGGFSPGNAAYSLASTFEEIWLRPDGMIGLTGIRMEMPFAREALDSIGVEAAIERRGAYKSFPEQFLLRGPTPENREMMDSLVDDLFEQMVSQIASGRDLPSGRVRRLVDAGPLLADEARDGGLVDRLGGRQAFEDRVDEQADGVDESLSARAYLRSVGEEGEAESGDRPDIALIYAAGTIMPSAGRPVLQDRVADAQKIAEAVTEASEDDDIQAIVLRVDSGGGSLIGSAIIAEAVDRAVADGKPVIVSMGGAAASGGYWIATHATAIVADPATLTGSIGVFAGKMVAEELWEELGVAWTSVQRGRNAGFWSSNEPYSRIGQERLAAMLDHAYGQFVERVAEGRNLAPEQVEGVAAGRVWTGAQAREIGLVDRLGGLDVAFDAAREAIDESPGADLDIVVLPEEPSLVERMLALVGQAPEIHLLDPDLLARFEPLIAPLLADGRLIGGMDGGDSVLLMPPLVVNF